MNEISLHWYALDTLILSQLKAASKRVEIYSPFVSFDGMKLLARSIRREVDVRILVRWRAEDLLRGVADFRLFDLCEERGWSLRAHPFLHLKTVLSDRKTLTTGSANVTERGLGTHHQSNLETMVTGLSPLNGYLAFLDKIWSVARVVDLEFVDKLKTSISTLRTQIPNLQGLLDSIEWSLESAPSTSNSFLVSELPMSLNWKHLYHVGLGETRKLGVEARECATHDLNTYGVKPTSTESIDEFRRRLQRAFLRHPFIRRFEEFLVVPRAFGSIKEWVQHNCVDVPVPSRRTLTGNVQVLYEWMTEFGDGRYSRSRPRFSEVLSPMSVREGTSDAVTLPTFIRRSRRHGVRKRRRRS